MKMDLSISRPRAVNPRPGVGVEPFEFTSNGGGGVALLCRVKKRKATFYEVVNEGR